MKREVRSCDNKDLGEVREVREPWLLVAKGDSVFRFPREAVGTYDGDKVYLRATEAEVRAGFYPFIRKEPGSPYDTATREQGGASGPTDTENNPRTSRTAIP